MNTLRSAPGRPGPSRPLALNGRLGGRLGAWLAALGLILPACTASAPPTEAQRATALWAALEAAIGPAHCGSEAQCRTVAVGQKACGGPESYLAWSTRGTDAAAVQRAADAWTAWQASQQRRGMVGNCMFVTDPGAVCQASPAPANAAAATAAGPGRCALREGDAALK